MKRVQIPINGITTNRNYQDGDCLSMINLRPKNGSLRPITPRDASKKIPFAEYDIIFIHRNNDYENWIGILNGDYHAQIFNVEDTVWIGNIDNEKILSVEQIGNTLSFITQNGIYYALFTEGKYKFLGQLPELPLIQFGEGDQVSYDYKPEDDNTYSQEDFTEPAKGALNKCIQNIQEEMGLYFNDFHLVRYAFKMYDGSLVKHSAPILLASRMHYTDNKRMQYHVIRYVIGNEHVYAGKMQLARVFAWNNRMTYDFTSLNNDWSDIIKSVDVFVSPALGIGSVENIRKEFPFDIDTETGQRTHNEPCNIEISKDTMDSLKDMANFYLDRSLNLGEKNTETIPSEKSQYSKLENIIYQEEMGPDSLSNHTYGAATSYTYNNRLHLANIKTTFFKGFTSNFFKWNGFYNGQSYVDLLYKVDSLIIETQINTGAGLEKVFSELSVNAESFLSTPYISYPDSRAVRMTVYELKNNICKKIITFPLTAHNFLDIAFYLKEDLLLIWQDNGTNVDKPDTSKIITTTESNNLKVSELNNPFFFPSINTYQIGDGKILNLASNIMSISDRNYSQFPLYIFTTTGIWTLQQGTGEVLYANISTPTYYEAPASSIITSTPYGVVFLTVRGLFIINGQQVTFLSPQLEEDHKELTIEKGEYLFKYIQNFKQSIPEVKEMIFNHFENELIITFNNSDYNLLFNFDSKQYFWNKEAVNFFVKNAYPNLFGSLGYDIKDWSKGGKGATVSFITRSLTFGTPDIKKIDRVILRGDLLNLALFAHEGSIHLPNITLFQSMDNYNFKTLRQLIIKPQSYRDINMGMFARSKYRNFSLIFEAYVDKKSAIDYIEINVEKEYNNEKMI